MASDSTLNALWREAVLLKCDNTCVICGIYGGVLEAHHIIPRRKAYLKHDIKDGVAVHKYECHTKAASKKGEALVREFIGEGDWAYLCEFERVILKDHLTSVGMSREEFSEFRKRELQEYIKGV